MDAITAITQAGSLVKAAKGLIGAIRGKKGGDGFQAELRSRMEANAAKFVARHDRDGSGGLSRTEFGIDGKLFGRLDGNGDGEITAAELAAARKQHP